MSETRKYRTFTAEQKIEIVLAGLRGDRPVRDVCREYGDLPHLPDCGRDDLHLLHHPHGPLGRVVGGERAEHAIPAAPSVNRPLADPALRADIEVDAAFLRLDLAA